MNAQDLLKKYYKREIFNIIMLKTKKLKLKINKNNFLKSE